MADPLRRTLFAKLRGKKSKKSPGGGTRSQEGKAKPPKERRRRQQQQQQEAGPGVVVGGAKVLAGSGSNGGEEQEQEEEEEEEEEEETRIPGIASGLGAQSPVPADEPGIAAQEMQPASGVQAAGGAGCPPEANGILCIGVAGLVAGALTGLELMEMSGSPLPTPLHASPSPGQQQPSRRQSIHSLDSQEEEEEEEEDYYDNQCLQGYYEPDIRGLRCPNLPTVPQSHLQTVLSQNCNRHRKHSLDSAQEKERLRTQLQEAYYLLIHAMHDMPMDNPASNRLGGVSCHSQDSVCTQSSVRVIDSDAWSSDEISLQQQVSDTDSLPGKHTGSPKKEFASKSIANLVSVIGRPSLPRSVSDGVINYANVSCLSDTESKDEQSEHTVHFRAFRGLHNEGQASCNAGSSHPSHSPSVNTSVCVKDVIQSSEGSMMLFKDSSCDVNKLRDSSDMVCGSCGKQDDSQGCSLKPPAVTVNKMQEWMHRGRMLSLEMKERISGSVRVSMPSGSLPGQATSKEVEVQKTSFPAAIRVQGNKTAPSPTSQRVLLTDFIENVHASSVSKRELKANEANELNDHRPHINNITVSKKRNWLQQSTLNPYLNEETNAPVTVELTNYASGLSPLQESRQQLADPPREHIRQNDPKHAAENSLDHSEENDADDEGEIWYNPIPEDEEVDLPQVQSPPRISVARIDNSSCSLQMKQCSLPAGDLIKGPMTLGISANCSESVREVQVVPAIDVNQGNSVNSTNSTDNGQLHRQICVCKFRSGASVEEICVHRPPVSAATDPSNGPVCAVAVVATAATTTEFSPPSSPNPLKKGTTINWSFPEKIKSPRTVRKLSMKMKKLPELSRKLSVKGTSNHNCNDNHNLSSKGNHGSSLSPGIVTNAASRNVISRYHLDSSVVSQNYKKKSSANSKSASKGGYLSDGDSPELVAKSGKHSCESKPAKGNIATSHKTHSTEIDIDAFRHYSFVDQPKCSQYISGLMSVHFYGAEDLKPPRIDSRDVFCAIQVDSVNKARTALLTCRTTFLDMDHTFNIELENAQHLKLVVFSWEPTPRRNRVCCHGTVVLPTLFRVSKMHQLAVKLEPRGLIYVKLTLMEQWENSLDSPDGEREPVMFGVEARKIVEKENTGLSVPLLMHKCIVEIEKRGCQVVGLYRLCGSAAVKKELREAFERDSKAVGLSENLYPDINVITGVLKDYLRELPSPLITKQLYEAVLDTMAKQPLKITSSGCENDFSDSEYTVGLLDCLPEVEKATLKMLLDHLKLVASYHEVNKMTCQNLAVCFGPVLLSQRQETSNHSHRVFTDSEELASALDFKKHIEVLHYLLQLWPVQNMGTKEHMESNGSSEQNKPINYVRRRKQRPAVLNLANAEAIGVLRPRQVRLDSPSNRYAGDWSSCGESYLLRSKEDSIEADYDDVPSEDTGSDEENTVADRTKCVMEPHAEAKSKEQTYEAYVRMQKINPALGHRVNLKDLQESIDTLIGNLERELSKNKLNATY
ncbi:rho GTPase-activating protein SYDE2 isoform X2 [Carcharodon carcharias]|uniref:rho GTPase-activating protein SYDE2 isoform X2 n=1 Tax=Carcharodon carcharias TaxID=13397 RepID=UPI001B7F1DC1|nr:rho GTPase-activating protein SYDE2 isoform X2 [Carcharodon carcharias]